MVFSDVKMFGHLDHHQADLHPRLSAQCCSRGKHDDDDDDDDDDDED